MSKNEEGSSVVPRPKQEGASEQHHSPVGAGRLVTHGGTEQIS